MEIKTDSSPWAEDHCSPEVSALQVPRIDKQTLPPAYMFGLNRQRPPLVVLAFTSGAFVG